MYTYHHMLNNRTFIVVLAVGFLAIFFAVPIARQGYPEAVAIGVGARDFEELSERFRVLAENKGALYAFEVLIRAQLPPNTDLHLLGHVIGDELYKQEGVSGISACTQDFRNACSHSIVVGTIGEYGGDAALAKVRDACQKAPGGSGAYTMCYHGLGHGVFASFGYDLELTVAFCQKTGTKEYRNREYIECVGGAIMELVGGKGRDGELEAVRGRYLSDEDPLAPCNTPLVPDPAKAQCYTYLTAHLLERAGADLGNPDPKTFPRAFGFCAAISEDKLEERRGCFGGFGKDFVPIAGSRDIRAVDYFPDSAYLQAITWCGAGNLPEGEAECVLEGLRSVFWGGENDTRASLRYCSLVDDPGIQEKCFRELGDETASYLTGRERLRVCRALPEYAQTSCSS